MDIVEAVYVLRLGDSVSSGGPFGHLPPKRVQVRMQRLHDCLCTPLRIDRVTQ